jgi:MFS superfamily sulfate permease-like transporter
MVIISLLAEAPHDVKYYFRSVVPVHFLKRKLTIAVLPHRMRAWIDMSLMLFTFFSTIVWNVEVGILASLVISLLLVVHRSSKTRMMILVGEQLSCA